MAKEKAVTSPSLASEMVQAGRYKKTQGKMARQVTLVTIWVMVAVATYQLYLYLGTFDFTSGNAQANHYVAMGVSGILTAAGFWFAYRLINWPVFADFLIAVEAEMNKVTWPTKAELWRSVIVVIAMILILTILLFSFDMFWNYLFTAIGLLPSNPTTT